uniref:Uncharacterized protein n=1 Tax=Romanomermis culicivorax TaxID=13658 RepID=A0A915KW54_ROMCU
EVALEWNDQSSVHAGTLKTEYVRDSNCHFKAALKWRAFRYELTAKLCPVGKIDYYFVVLDNSVLQYDPKTCIRFSSHYKELYSYLCPCFVGRNHDYSSDCINGEMKIFVNVESVYDDDTYLNVVHQSVNINSCRSSQDSMLITTT